MSSERLHIGFVPYIECIVDKSSGVQLRLFSVYLHNLHGRIGARFFCDSLPFREGVD